MAQNASRSMNAELDQGSLDGSIKLPNPNRGGEIEPTTAEARRGLGPNYEIADGRGLVELPVPRFMKIRI